MGSNTQVYHDPSYLQEVWILFGVGVAVIAVRLLVRMRQVGLRQFQGDDYMTILVLGCYAADAITVTIIYLEGSNVDYIGKEQQLETFDKAQINRIVYGSKMEMIAWYTYTALIWGLKACMLFFYNRLTWGLTQQLVVKALAVVSVITYIAMFLTITLSCNPIHLNWQVRPIPPEKCTIRKQNFIVCTTLNVLTDAALLVVPLPLLWKLQVTLRKKITLTILLCSGIFIITAAIVRIAMTLTSHPSALTINRWGVRETIAGICAVNAPIMKPMFKKSFWNREYRIQAAQRAQRQAGSGRSPDGSSGRSSRRINFHSILRKPEPVELMEYSGSKASKMTKTETNTTSCSKSQCTTARTNEPEPGVQHDNISQECFLQRPPQTVQFDGRGDLDIECAPPGNSCPHPVLSVDDVYAAPWTHADRPQQPERSLSSWQSGKVYRSSLE